MNIMKSQIPVAMGKIWDVNSSDWFTFNRFLYYLLLRFLQILPPEVFFINRVTWGKQGSYQNSYPEASAVQYFLGKTTERTQALGVTSGVSLGTPISAMGSVSRDTGTLMRHRWWFSCGFFPCTAQTWWELHGGCCLSCRYWSWTSIHKWHTQSLSRAD